ncbi:MAG: hypothetical protein M1836_002081 [Candelina mexicana]|nr:MAG: hypothetical protein M1836_002081 [Candelina mexicana]
MFFTAILLSLTSLCSLAAAGELNGRAKISVHQYPETGRNAPNNPPFCGMPWHALDLNRITAVQDLTQSQCGTCLEICGVKRCITMLAVDRGGQHLDMSTGVSLSVIGTENGVAEAWWKVVDLKWCHGIHHKLKEDDEDDEEQSSDSSNLSDSDVLHSNDVKDDRLFLPLAGIGRLLGVLGILNVYRR